MRGRPISATKRKGVPGVARKQGKLTAQQRTAAEMLGGGAKIIDVAAEIGVHRSQIARWQQRPDFQAAVDTVADRLIMQLGGKVAKMIDMQMDAYLDSKNGPRDGWLAQGAARIALDTINARRKDQAAAGGATVVFNFGSPGTPEDAEQEDVDSP